MTQETASFAPNFFDPNWEVLSQPASQEALQTLMDERVSPLLDDPFEAVAKGEQELNYKLDSGQLVGSALAERYDFVDLSYFYADDPDDPNNSAPDLRVTVSRLPRADDPEDTGISTLINLSGPWDHEGGAVHSDVVLFGKGTRILQRTPDDVSVVAAPVDREAFSKRYNQVGPTAAENEKFPPATVADLQTIEQVLDAVIMNHPELLAKPI